jgi:subtilase family serine protease
MLLVLKRSAAQEAALRKLLDDQQDKASPNYHKWLTPETFGEQFGPTDIDMQTITSWLQSHGFQVGSTKGRTVLEFSGTAGQVQEAFHTSIHKYLVNDEQHWANASDPMIPTALTPAVAGVLTLHNFIKKPTIHLDGQPVPAKLVPGKKPQVTFTQNGQVVHALAPSDFSVIYNINPVYQNLIAGLSVGIGVVGRSNLYNGGTDVEDFTGTIGFGGGGVGGAPFDIILNGPDPGDLGGGEEAEATLDSTWATTVASGVGSVVLVVSATTNTTDGIDLSEAYIVENNLTDIMTESFSACELYATDAQLAGSRALAEQAAAQGISYIVSTGDNGAEGCDDPNSPPATHPISVNYLASTGFNVAVGGTMFNENGQDTKYWSSTAPISETALSYIPENVWNESSLTNGLWAGSGGASGGNVSSGVGTTPGLGKPSWQFGVQGIPTDGVRDLPDVSLTAAAHDPYLLCLEGSCVPNGQGQIFVYFISGTSASAPSFAGIMSLVVKQQALLNQNNGRQGNPNYVLYRLAASQSAYPNQCNGSNTSGLPAEACIFNDVTVGNNVVPGETGTQYQATAGYDTATGLGSVNVANLVSQWNTVTFNPTTTALSVTPKTVNHGSPVPFTVTVTPSSGSGVPTGDVTLVAASQAAGPINMGFWTLSGGSVSSTIDTMPGGSTLLTAYYSGDSTFASSQSVASNYFTVKPENSTTTETLLAYDQNGNPISLTSVPFGDFVYLRADVHGVSGQGVPTGNVTFADTFGAIPGGSSFPLNSEGNTANPNGVTFDAGTHTLSASYSGDASFKTSSTSQSQSVVISPGFFAAVPASASQVVITSPGLSGSSSIGISNSTNFSGTITLTCAGLPAEAACVFSPSSITASGAPGTTTASITVTTTAATAALASRRRILVAGWTVGIGLLFSVVLMGGTKRQLRGACMFLLMLAVIGVPGCGGGGGGSKGPPPNPGTPAGSYNIAVSATSGSSVSTSGFLLVVQ